jgi:hypothetical protein
MQMKATIIARATLLTGLAYGNFLLAQDCTKDCGAGTFVASGLRAGCTNNNCVWTQCAVDTCGGSGGGPFNDNCSATICWLC